MSQPADTSTAAVDGGTDTASVLMVKPTGLAGDMNAGFAFFLDVVVNLFVLSGILVGAFGFPADIVFLRIIPGAIVGILVGNIAFSLYANHLKKTTNQPYLTTIPAGLDLPTVFGMAFFIVGPLFQMNQEAMGEQDAAMLAWGAGMAATLWMAVIKFLLSFVSRVMQTEMPQIALIGAMAGIATVWLGAEAALGLFQLPEVGLVAFGVMAFSLIAGHRLPFAFPGAIAAILLATAVYYVLAFGGAGEGYMVPASPELIPALPKPTFLGIESFFGPITGYLGLVFPFALLIAASSVNVIAGARITGDRYDPATIIRLDAASTALSALFGGVVQTTPYFGHPTYKRMGAGTGYSIAAAAIITVGGFAGVIAFASVMVPEPVLKPILIVVAADIMRLAFSAGEVKHAPAVLLSLIPAILNYAFTKVNDLYTRIPADVQQSLGASYDAGFALLGTLSRGYILTSLIWGAMIVWIIDRAFFRAAFAAFLAALLTGFGVIHSVLPSSGMYFPWNLPDLNGLEGLVTRLAAAYMILGVLMLIASQTREKD